MLAVLATLVPVGRADDGDASELTGDAAVAVVVAGADGAPLAPAKQATVQVSMEHALEHDERLAVVDQDDQLARRAGRVPADAVAEARALVTAGDELLRRGKPKLALLKLQGAAVELARVLAWTSKQDLARAQYLLGAAQAMSGDRKGALATFVALLTWRPDAVPDPDLAPDVTLPVWEDARHQLDEAAQGGLAIESSPPGALAYVDGHLVGFTPTSLDGLTVGVHYVTLRREGYERRVEAVKVGARTPGKLDAVLVPSARARDLAAAKAVFAAGIESPEVVADARAALAEIGALLAAEQVVLVTPAAKEGRYLVSVYATDGGARLARKEIRSDGDLESAFAEAMPAVYDQVARATARIPVRKVARRRPIYKNPWFWGGVAAAVAVGVTVPLLLSGDEPLPGCPSGSSCGQVVLRF